MYRLALVVLVALLATAPALPRPLSAQEPALVDLWPNGDGTQWEYAYSYTEEAWLGGSSDASFPVRYSFDGMYRLPDGRWTQNLAVAVPVVSPVAREGASAAPASLGDPLLRTLWRVRPDLRPGLLQRAAALDAGDCIRDAAPNLNALLLHDAWFLKTEEEIAAWGCDLDSGATTLKRWLWLTADLGLGHTFGMQLVPDLADDVFLHGTPAAWEEVSTLAGTFTGCLRVDYVIDYGTSLCTAPGETGTGSYRAETRGSVYYAPGVGPVYSTEEFLPFLDVTGSCDIPAEGVGQVASRTTLDLTLVDVVPARRTSWGALKSRYE